MVLHTKMEDLEKNETDEAGGSRFQKQASKQADRVGGMPILR